MTTIVERNSGDSSVATMLVGVVAIIAIIALALYLFRVFPFAQPTSNDSGIKVDIEGQMPTPSNNNGQ